MRKQSEFSSVSPDEHSDARKRTDLLCDSVSWIVITLAAMA